MKNNFVKMNQLYMLTISHNILTYILNVKYIPETHLGTFTIALRITNNLEKFNRFPREPLMQEEIVYFINKIL